MKTINEVKTNINHLLEVLNERITGYRKASENVTDPEFKTMFDSYSLQAADFQKELMPYSSISPEEAGTRVQGDAWRFWMDMKAALTTSETKAMVNASITGEEAAIKNYEEILDDDIPVELRNILNKQLVEIKSAYNKLKSYKF
ncbi:MAG: PA2169 family four-helix-bundle protein [Cytophagaceae bacterium]